MKRGNRLEPLGESVPWSCFTSQRPVGLYFRWNIKSLEHLLTLSSSALINLVKDNGSKPVSLEHEEL